MQQQGVSTSDEIRPDVFLISLGERARRSAPGLLRLLRKQGYRAAASYGARSMRSQMRHADRSGAPYGLILGDEEMEKGLIACREMASGQQTEFPLDELVTRFAGLAGRPAARPVS
jgi:histidyl-tRNA synthetase